MKNNKQQKAVEQMFQEMLEIQQSGKTLTFDENLALLKKYKEMEKERIINAWKAGDGQYDKVADKLAEQYYNETYGGGEQ